ncbi:MAG: hypothetical protein IPP33_11835 [Flavobacteriales bacterium]|nr:hypothetical protein [Flavobacteriales bacterium]
MEPVNYIGEHGWAGHWGHWLALISFTGALFSGIGYLLFTQNGDTGWRSVGRLCFRAHSLAVLGIIVTLFVMLFKHWFEFDYVWKHSNTLMPLQYIAQLFLGRPGRLIPAVHLLDRGAGKLIDPSGQRMGRPGSNRIRPRAGIPGFNAVGRVHLRRTDRKQPVLADP